MARSLSGRLNLACRVEMCTWWDSLRMKSSCWSAFNGRPGGCLFSEGFQVCGQYLSLKLRTPLVKGCITFEFPYPNHPTFTGRRRVALWFDAKWLMNCRLHQLYFYFSFQVSLGASPLSLPKLSQYLPWQRKKKEIHTTATKCNTNGTGHDTANIWFTFQN